MASRYIPEELVMEILARLPAKLLVRFRCVCKSWYALMRNPKFVTKHLSNPTSLHNNEETIIITKHLRRGESKVSLLSNKTLHFSDAVSMPFFDNDDSALNLHIYGPCDGVVCIYSTHTHVHGDKIALWNPTTRDFKALPLSTVPPLPDNSLFGIGFDSTTNEYKVVRISTYHINKPINVSQVEVYTLSTNSWRKVETIVPSTTIYRHQRVSSTYLKGFYYWLACDRGSNDHTILSFDMSKEVFRKISAPPSTGRSSLVVLQELNGSIALCVNGWSTSNSRMLTIWVWLMNNDASGGITANVNVTWIKQYTVTNYPHFSYVLGFHKNGDLLMQSGGELVTYSPSTQEFEYYGVHERGILLQVHICKESLVSLSTI